MNLPTKLTVSRIILSPVFFLVWFLPIWTGHGAFISAIFLIVLFIVQELTDVLDGAIARKRNLVTEVGKVLDPFADVMSRMTFFICFTGSSLMPVWVFTILLYRELAITFLRLLMIRRGIAMAASIWGKLKAVVYTLAGITGISAVVISRFGLSEDIAITLETIALYVFILAALASVSSFVTYAVRARRVLADSEQGN